MIRTITNKESINEALKSLKAGDTLYLEEGIYYEKVKITTDNITIIGSNIDKTIIVNSDYSTKTHLDNKEFNTFRTYTVLVMAANVTIKNLSIKNEATPSSTFGQAVALHVLGDLFSIDNCQINGAQDTIFCGPLPHDLVIRYKDFLPQDELANNKKSRQLYTNCKIYGDVDFIFGCGTAIFKNCTIYSISTKSFGYIAAPSHSMEQKYGFTFIDCSLLSLGAKEDSVYLARPWRDYGKAVFINCKMDKHIKKCGWNKWNDTSRDKTCYFAEYSPEVDTSARLPFGHILTKEDSLIYNIKEIFADYE